MQNSILATLLVAFVVARNRRNVKRKDLGFSSCGVSLELT